MDFLSDFFADIDFLYVMIVAGVFALLPVMLFFGFLSMNKKRVRMYNSQLRAREEPMDTKWMQMRPKLAFTVKDKRALFIKKAESVNIDEEPKKPLINRGIFFILLIVFSLVAPFAAFYLEYYVIGMVVPFILFFGAIIFGLNSPVEIMKKREKILKNMYQIVQSNIGVESELSGNINAVIQVTKWGVDGLTPMRVDIAVPPTFNSAGELGFIEQFNQVYGNNSAWVARSVEEGVPGWDYENGVVHMYAVPPLPTIAPWSERYVLDPGIAWSYFPLGLGAENGVEMLNPETGKNEYVLGFDVAGNQKDYAKKAGYKTGEEIAGAAPMALIAGKTGGGKSISCDTPVKRVVLPADM